MKPPKATIKQAWPYQQDLPNLPVNNLVAALPFYEKTMGFRLVSRTDLPHQSVVLTRDTLQMGLAENGGDSTQDGCFFKVDRVINAFAELTANGLPMGQPNYTSQQHGAITWKVFFVVAPDGLCFCFGERQ